MAGSTELTSRRIGPFGSIGSPLDGGSTHDDFARRRRRRLQATTTTDDEKGTLRRVLSILSIGGRRVEAPANIQTCDRSLQPNTPGILTLRDSGKYTVTRHESSRIAVNKPLPLTPPLTPCYQTPTQAKIAPLQRKAASTPDETDMSRPVVSRANTMDLAAAGGAPEMYGRPRKESESPYLGNHNNTQTSLGSNKEGDGENKDISTPRSGGMSASPAQPGSGGNGNPPGAPTSSSTHLSGLMCNVHRTTGKEPHALVGATTTILGDKLYVFGGKILSRTRAALTADLFELDLIRRHWTKLETLGDTPPPRYFHSMCSLGDTKLVCYGGMSPATQPNGHAFPPGSQNGQENQPEVVVMSDIHIYDAPTNTWMYIPTQETPQGRYAHCATILPSSVMFSNSSNAPLSALQHNPSGDAPNQGAIGVNIDGAGGAEMVVVGGQDSANHYIEQISVFNLRSLKWTRTQQLGKSCGAYRSVVAPLPAAVASQIGKGTQAKTDNGIGPGQEARDSASSMLIYSNYNFLDVKLELQIRAADGTLTERPMNGSFTPPGLRFPNGGVIATNFVVSGTYLTSSKQEYALWALDLRTLTWSRIDAGGTVFSQGSWNRGVLWPRRNTFVILGNRRRSLVEDYNHRRLNFSHACMVELEAFGLYDNPRATAPMGGFVSASSPHSSLPTPPLPPAKPTPWNPAGRSISAAATALGALALSAPELADMHILAVGGERIPASSRVLARRWGPYFTQLLREGAAAGAGDANDAATLRPSSSSRMSSATLLSSSSGAAAAAAAAAAVPEAGALAPAARPRTLYLPHTALTVQALLHFVYTSALPQPCSPQILCSLLQLARPYRVEGLVEAVVERLHGLLDARNAAAVFNAAAMGAGGGRGIGTGAGAAGAGAGGEMAPAAMMGAGGEFAARGGLRIDTTGTNGFSRGGGVESGSESGDGGSAVSEGGAVAWGDDAAGMGKSAKREREVWTGGLSAVIGLQKRGLRGLMEGRRLRERGQSQGQQGGRGPVGLGIT